ncbi:O-antigen ligase family protein [Georgenia alba]|uniref:O-antigen ligase family protein n=1 Tax=Georgenia alba TaxID=2233858 RepID=A0ABW2Q628_9MICO
MSVPSPPRRRQAGPWLAYAVLPLVALFVPAAIVLPGPLESNGWPGRLLVFVTAAVVVLTWLRRPGRGRLVSPAEAGCWVLALGVVIAFGAAYLRPLTSVEAAGTIRVALVLLPLLIVAIGIAALTGVGKIDLLLVCVVVGASASAFVAITQFVTPYDLAELIRPPGFIAREVGGMGDRGGFIRVKGSATHPIEFGVVSGAVAPIALHLALHARSAQGRQWAAMATGMLVLGLLLAVTRSGVVTVIIAMAVYAVRLTVRQRLNLVVLAVTALVLMRAAVPGLLGTLTGFFLGAGEDDSVTARTDDYPLIAALFAERPLLGRGLGTFLPEEYFLLDNQYLMSLVEGGVVLVAALAVFIVLALAGAHGAVRRARDAREASRAQAVTAAIASILAAGFFFDLFSFAQVTVLLFVLVGAAGALWRHGVEHGVRIPTPRERVRRGAGTPLPPVPAAEPRGPEPAPVAG